MRWFLLRQQLSSGVPKQGGTWGSHSPPCAGGAPSRGHGEPEPNRPSTLTPHTAPLPGGGIQNHQPDREGPTACCSTELRPRFTAGCSVTAPVPPMGTGSVRWDLGSVQCRVCLRSPVCFQDWIQETQKQRCQHES